MDRLPARRGSVAHRPLLRAGRSAPSDGARRRWVDWRLGGACAAPRRRRCRSATPAAFLAYLREVEIGRQIAYHRAAYRRFRRLDPRLRRAASTILWRRRRRRRVGGDRARPASARAGVVARRGRLGAERRARALRGVNGLRSQLDVERQAARSARIGLALRRLRRALDGAPPNAALARSAAGRARRDHAGRRVRLGSGDRSCESERITRRLR